MDDNEYISESPNHDFYEDWDSKLEKEHQNKSFNESSMVLDNGTLYGSSKGLGKRRVISSLEDSKHIPKEDH